MLVVNDYAIVQVATSKRALVRCVSVADGGKKFKGVLQEKKSNGEDTPPVIFSKSEIVANLGRSPKVGSVYGVSIEPLRQTAAHPFFGDVHIYKDMDDVQRNKVRGAMSAVAKGLTKLRLPELSLTTEVRTPHGKMVGFYKYRPKADSDVLCFKPDDDVSNMDYVISHEYAHGLWFRCLTPKMQAAWVRLYHDAITLSDVKKDELAQLLDDVKTYGDLGGFMRENPDTVPTIRAIFRHIKQVHSIDRKHFELALVVGDEVDLYWPSKIELSEKQVLLTEYARKSPEELFAEAFALRFSGKKLPKKVDDLLSKCLTRLVKQ